MAGMRLIIGIFIIAAFWGCQPEPQWIALFNGKDLDGWTPKFAGLSAGENYLNTFQVKNGLLTVSYAEHDSFRGEFGHLFYKNLFHSYRLRAEYRFVGQQLAGGPGWAYRNNGLMLHCQSVESMLLDQEFPVSIEAQLLGGNGRDERPTANVCTPGLNISMDGLLRTEHCINSNSKTYHGDQWVTMEVVVSPDQTFYHLMYGDTVLVYHSPVVGGGSVPVNYALKDGTPVSEGYIAIQAETHPIEFRKIELQVIE